MSLLRFSLALLLIIGSFGCGRTPLPMGEDAGTDTSGDGGCTSDFECDDGLGCNGRETCVRGSCLPGAPIECDDGIDCTRDVCEEGTGCTGRPDDGLCPPGFACNPGSGCVEEAPCMTDRDCNDDVFCNGEERCEENRCRFGEPVRCDDDVCGEGVCDERSRECIVVGRPTDRDGDGFVDARCGGDDCDDSDPRVAPGFTEECADGRDNNCNMLTDCDDPVCLGTPRCECGAREVCDTIRDDDCDGLVNCDDPDCAMDPSCICVPEPERCGNGRDDDCDGRADCDDRDCADDPRCAECIPTPERCGNRVDDDCDGFIDCDDRDCADNPRCDECVPSPERCDSMRDEDCDGDIDCDDEDCADSDLCMMMCLDREICFNGIDDDCNGLTDCEDACARPEVCRGGIDDDCDGLVDCDDPSCAGDEACPDCVPTRERCNDGIDTDCDGDVDCDDDDCADAAACSEDRCRVTDLGSRVGPAVVRATTEGRPNVATPSCVRASNAGERAYSWTAPFSGTFTANTNGSAYDTVLYARETCEIGRDVACNDDGGTGTDSQIRFRLAEGDSIVIVVDGFGSSEGEFILNIGSAEVCDDMIDNDTDGDIDCDDSDCALNPVCCTPEREVCGDMTDNDCDGRVDCGDPDCAADPACCVPRREFCRGGVDEDCDGDIDCDDSDCAGTRICCEPEPGGEVCGDMRDNDCDGDIDCDDSACDDDPACCEPAPTGEACGDMSDNDCDGDVDCDDSDCAAACTSCPERNLGRRLGTIATGTTVGRDNGWSASCTPGGSAGDISFRWRAPARGRYEAFTDGSTFDTTLTVREGCLEPELICDDDGGMGTASRVVFGAAENEEVIFVLDGFGDAEGTFQFAIRAL